METEIEGNSVKCRLNFKQKQTDNIEPKQLHKELTDLMESCFEIIVDPKQGWKLKQCRVTKRVPGKYQWYKVRCGF